MSTKYLSVDKDDKFNGSHAVLWAKRDIGCDRVDNMQEGIKRLLSGTYLFIGINSDNVDFLPMLNAMRHVTDIPLLVATGAYDFHVHKEAKKNGADLYARWQANSTGNIEAVLMHITWMNEHSKHPRPSTGLIMCDGLLILQDTRYAYAGDNRLDLTTQEFDLLYYLMDNHGRALPYARIYENVWNDKFVDAQRDPLWDAIRRLRGKLQISSGGQDYIETLRGFGYRFITR